MAPYHSINKFEQKFYRTVLLCEESLSHFSIKQWMKPTLEFLKWIKKLYFLLIFSSMTMLCMKNCINLKIDTTQVNLCQKFLFLHQLTHNMTTDCSLNCEINTWKFQAQTCGEHVVYRNCFWLSEQFLYATCSPHVLQKEELLTKIYLYSSVNDFGSSISEHYGNHWKPGCGHF